MIPIDKLAKKLEEEGHKSVAFFNNLPETQWSRQLYADGSHWTVQQVLAHIVQAEHDLLKLFKKIAGGGEGVSEEFDLDAVNHKKVNQVQSLPVSRLLELFAEYRSETVRWVSSIDQAVLAMTGRHPFLGIATLDEMIKLLYRHIQIHQRDVRRMPE